MSTRDLDWKQAGVSFPAMERLRRDRQRTTSCGVERKSQMADRTLADERSRLMKEWRMRQWTGQKSTDGLDMVSNR